MYIDYILPPKTCSHKIWLRKEETNVILSIVNSNMENELYQKKKKTWKTNLFHGSNFDHRTT